MDTWNQAPRKAQELKQGKESGVKMTETILNQNGVTPISSGKMVRFAANVPIEIALQCVDGVRVEGRYRPFGYISETSKMQTAEAVAQIRRYRKAATTDAELASNSLFALSESRNAAALEGFMLPAKDSHVNKKLSYAKGNHVGSTEDDDRQ
jgi:hypothetical protein